MAHTRGAFGGRNVSGWTAVPFSLLFLPLLCSFLHLKTQTGSGALSASDVECIRSGFIVPVISSSGEAIFLANGALLPATSDRETWFRCGYYFATVLDDLCWVAEGATVVHIVTSGRRPNATFELVRIPHTEDPR